MSKFFDRLDRISDLLDGKRTPDEILENNAKLAGRPVEMPGWYRFIIRRLGLVLVVLAILIVGIIVLKTRSTAYASAEGVKAVMYMLTLGVGIILLPLMAAANIQRKLSFRNDLPADLRVTYDKSIKKRVKDFILLLAVALIVTVILVTILLYINS